VSYVLSLHPFVVFDSSAFFWLLRVFLDPGPGLIPAGAGRHTPGRRALEPHGVLMQTAISSCRWLLRHSGVGRNPGSVMPADAGIQRDNVASRSLDPGVHRGDEL